MNGRKAKKARRVVRMSMDHAIPSEAKPTSRGNVKYPASSPRGMYKLFKNIFK